MGEINQVTEDGEWELIRIIVDSGAIDNVCSEEVGKQFAIMETDMSKKGGYYVSASKHKIFNKFESTIIGTNIMGVSSGMTFQACEVKNPLGSVRRICEAGNRVILDEEYSYIENKSSAVITPLEKERGVYYLGLWIRRVKNKESF